MFPYIKNMVEFSRKIEINDTEQGDIIKFYNEVYIPAVKSFIISLKSTDKKFNTPMAMSPSPRVFYPQSEIKRPTVPLFPMQSPIKEALNSPFHLPMSVNNRKYSSTLLTPLTKKLYSFGETLESPQKNLYDFKNKIMGNPRILKRIDFDNNDLVNKNKMMLKKQPKVEELKLNFKPQFFNFKKRESAQENNNISTKNIISNFNENDQEKTEDKNTNSMDFIEQEKKANKTPEFKK